MCRRPPRSTLDRSSAASDVYKRQQLIHAPEVTPEHFSQPDWLNTWAAVLQASLKPTDDSPRAYRAFIRAGDDKQGPRSVVERSEHGTVTSKTLPREFFESNEYRRIAELGRQLRAVVGEGGTIVRGNERHEFRTFKDAMTWLFDQARKGQTIQRYKGLGEMNPAQLWDTTINPETRRLVQVRIEDAHVANELFSTLMGDEVEPRREFIERNALLVSNLDV